MAIPTTAISANWQRIDTSEADGGLASAYKVGPVADKIIAHLKDAEGVLNMADFVNLFSADEVKREGEFEEFVRSSSLL